MKNLRIASYTVLAGLLLSSSVFAAETPAKTFSAPNDMKITVKEIGPVTQTTDLQIICAIKHGSNDKYIEAMQDFNDKQGGFLSAIRKRGEFVGELGETFLYTPPAGSITPKSVLLIGIGDAKGISLERLRLAGRIAAREAVRLQAKNVSFAPTLRDQGSSVVDVGDGDAAFAQQVILAYDTEKKLQAQKLAPSFSIEELTIEAGPKYFDGAVAKVGAVVDKTAEEMKKRDSAPYVKEAN
jgi:hypothetical protein